MGVELLASYNIQCQFSRYYFLLLVDNYNSMIDKSCLPSQSSTPILEVIRNFGICGLLY